MFGSVTDPVGEGVIDDFTHPPKANFTGICHPVKVEDRFQFILDLLPHAKTLGLIYADMPQSRSYNAWVRSMVRTPPFQHLTVLFRQVEFVKSEGGHKRMALLAKQHVLELNDQVDAFVAPNDQMGGQQPFAAMVFRHASKPLIGLNRPDVMEAWGATASMYPSFVWAGKKAGQMIHALLEGQSIQTLIPVWPRTGIALDLHKAEHFGLTISSEMLQRAGNNVRK